MMLKVLPANVFYQRICENDKISSRKHNNKNEKKNAINSLLPS